MATKGAIGILRETSMNRLKAAMDKIAGVARIDVVDLPTDRDTELQMAKQLDAFATWAERVQAHFARMHDLAHPEKSAQADFSEDLPPLDDAGTEPLDGFTVTPDGVITAQTDEGAVTSAGQDTPKDEPPAPEAAVEDKPAEKGKSKVK